MSLRITWTPSLGGTGLLCVASFWLCPASALAATNCEFAKSGGEWRLVADCETDETLVIPGGVTLDGDGHRVTAHDPADGHFTGAVVRNGGDTMNVHDLTIETNELANVCDRKGPPDQRLRGIFLESASGSIVDNRVFDVRQQRSGCDEGHGIEARNPPYDGSHLDTQHVHIAGNRVEGYQKTGILVLGDVRAGLYFNHVVGLGPIGFIAQNGIQMGRGARGKIRLNSVRFNIFARQTFAATGILVREGVRGIGVTFNEVRACDVGIRLERTNGARVTGNRVSGSTFDGISVDGLEGEARNHRIVGNHLRDNPVGINVFGAGAIGNVVRGNHVRGSSNVGIQVAAEARANWLHRNRIRDGGTFGIWVGTRDNGITANRVRGTEGTGLRVDGARNHVRWNRVRDSGELDIENTGDNYYARNTCEQSSGPPVDCP